MSTEGAPAQERQESNVSAPQLTRRQVELGVWLLVPLCVAGVLIWKWEPLAGSLVPLSTDDTAGAAWRVTIVWLRWNLIALYLVCALPGFTLLVRGPGGWLQVRRALTGAAVVAGLGTAGLWSWGLPGATHSLYGLLTLLALWPALLAVRVLLDMELESEADAQTEEQEGAKGPAISSSPPASGT